MKFDYIKEIDINENGIAFNIFGQIFKERVFNDYNYPPKEWMISFGQKLQYMGMMIERQAKHGVPVKIQNANEELITIGFDEFGRLLLPE